jgi:predicted lipoprotein with Yx(FWY)xxD motif
MKRLLLSLAALVAFGALAVGLASASASDHSVGRGGTVATSGSKLGRILVDSRGRTLYLFSADTHGKSACNGMCAGFWPPLIASGKPLAKSGAKASLLGTIRRADGRLQVTYNHHPLYAFAKDTAKGQTNGEGLSVFGGKWWAISPAGAKVVAGATAGTGTTSPSSGGYGGYGGYGY